MSLIRLITYFIAGYLIWKFLKWLVTPAKRKNGSNVRNDSRGKSRLLIKCAACGTFITEARALMVRGRAYCSATCASAADRA